MNDTLTIPPGHRLDAQGRWVPENRIKPIDRLRDELVHELTEKAKAVRAQIAAFKREAFEAIDTFVQMSADEYGVALGGKKGNVSLLSFDGALRINRQVAEAIQFDERLQAAKSLIDACLIEWTADARPEIATLVQDAFRVDAAGKIRTGSILAYVRFYERDASGEYQAIVLDIAGA